MSDAAARFASDLDAFLGGRPLPPGADEPALRAAGLLARADFAAQSRVRLSLRARLLSRPRRPAPRAWSAFPLRLPAGLAAAFAAAAVVLLLMRPRAPEPPPPATSASESSRPAFENALPVETAPRVPSRRVRTPAPSAEQSPFISIPAGSPFETHGTVSAGRPFVTVPGRRTRTARGRAVVWEFGHATFRLEDRPVSIDDLFVKPNL